MQEMRNKTPYAIAVLPFVQKDGRSVSAAIAKATFTLNEGGSDLVFAEEQVPIGFADDRFEADNPLSSIRYAGEAVPKKEGTDVAVVGHAYSPKGMVKAMDVQLRLGPLYKHIRIFGDRIWRRSFGRWKISDPKPFEQMPLRYEFAFGGRDIRHSDPARHSRDHRNPIGTGFVANGGRRDLEGLKLPNLEQPDALIKSLKDRPPVAGFGFIDPGWEPRISYAGTYDDQWTQTRNPLLPDDFDERFYNAAHPDLVAVPHLSGGELFQLTNVARTGPLRFNLPKKCIHVRVSKNGQPADHLLKMDTVVVASDDRRLMITWRATFDCDIDMNSIDWVEFSEEI